VSSAKLQQSSERGRHDIDGVVDHRRGPQLAEHVDERPDEAGIVLLEPLLDKLQGRRAITCADPPPSSRSGAARPST
jgi:hypothetical protein